MHACNHTQHAADCNEAGMQTDARICFCLVQHLNKSEIRCRPHQMWVELPDSCWHIETAGSNSRSCENVYQNNAWVASCYYSCASNRMKHLGKDSNLDLKHHQHISVVLGLGSHGRLSWSQDTVEFLKTPKLTQTETKPKWQCESIEKRSTWTQAP